MKKSFIKKSLYLLTALLIFSIVPFILKMNASADTLIEINSTNFPDYNFRSYITQNLDFIRSNGKTYVTQDTFNSVRELNLDCKGGIEYSNLAGLNYFKNLEKLSCVQNPSLMTIDVTQNKELKELYCYNTGIKSLNLRYNTNLEILECQNCGLTSLDVTQNTKLKELNCRNNALAALNVICNPELTKLQCHQNKISVLNLDNNTKLEYLSCNNNNLTSLRFKNNAKLTLVYCGNNSISSIENIGSCSKLESLDCSNNKLSSLDVNNNTKLLSLNCRNNSLTYLSVRNSKNLAELICNGNTIENLVINESGVLHELRKSATRQTNDINKTITYQNGDKIIVTDLTTNTQELPANITVVEMDETAIRALVTRLYYTMLKRDPEKGAVDTWTNRILNKEVNGVELGKKFALGDEITKTNPVSNTEFVSRLYKTFLNREGSSDEINSWVSQLNSGKSREYVVAGFVNSKEFDNFCKECGITRGNMTVSNPNATTNNSSSNNKKVSRFKITATNVDNAKLEAYVNRLYTNILRRDSEAEGVEYWKKAIIDGKDAKGNIYDAATAPRLGFFESKEYLKKNTTNEQFVVDAYEAFLGRNPLDPKNLDLEGYNYWLTCLKNGTYDRKTMLDVGFGNSKEFKNILESYGFTVTVQ